MQIADVVGIVAALFTTASFLPQAIRIFKTKSTKDLSIMMYIMFVAGIFLWMVYGILLKSLPLILANSVTLCFAAGILLMKIRFG